MSGGAALSPGAERPLVSTAETSPEAQAARERGRPEENDKQETATGSGQSVAALPGLVARSAVIRPAVVGGLAAVISGQAAVVGG